MPGHFLQKSRHKSVYYFRRRVPDDLRAVFGMSQIYRTLETSDKRTAIIRARVLAARTDQLFGTARTMSDKNELTLGYVMEVDLSDWGQPKKVRIEANGPEEHAAAQKAIDSLMQARAHHAQEMPHNSMETMQASSRAHVPVPKSIARAKDESIARTDIKPTMRKSIRTKANHLIKLVGRETDIFSIDQKKLIEIADSIKADTCRHPNTQKDYINVIGGFINWHRIKNALPELSTKGLRPKITTPQIEIRTDFTWQQVEGIFEYVARNKQEVPHMFWATVFVAFTGCRIEELCQIDLHQDLVQDVEKDIWYLNFNQREDADSKMRKSMKKPSSWRQVPIHSALVRHGFVDYLQAQKAAGLTRPFESAWPPHEDSKTSGEGSSDGLLKWSHKATKAGSDAKKLLIASGVIGANDKVGYFHSHRHTLNTLLERLDIGESHRTALLGQSAGGGENRRYGHLKQNHVFLSGLIEKHLGDYAELLDRVLAKNQITGDCVVLNI